MQQYGVTAGPATHMLHLLLNVLEELDFKPKSGKCSMFGFGFMVRSNTQAVSSQHLPASRQHAICLQHLSQ